jgi:hypothetical protein
MILVVELPNTNNWTGAKGSTQTNKKFKVRVQKKGAKETEENPGLAHRTVSGAPGSIQAEFSTFRFLDSRSAIIHRTVRWVTELSGVPSRATVASATVDFNGRLTT